MGSRPSAGRASDATATATTPAKRRMCAHGPASGFPVVSSEVNRQEGRKEERTSTGGRVNSNIPSRARSLESLPLFTPACSSALLTHPRVSSPPIRMTQKPIQYRQPSVGGEPPSIRASREGNSSSHIWSYRRAWSADISCSRAGASTAATWPPPPPATGCPCT